MNSYNAGLALGKDIARKWQDELSKYQKYMDNPAMMEGIQDGILSVLNLKGSDKDHSNKEDSLSRPWGNLNKD